MAPFRRFAPALSGQYYSGNANKNSPPPHPSSRRPPECPQRCGGYRCACIMNDARMKVLPIEAVFSFVSIAALVSSSETTSR